MLPPQMSVPVSLVQGLQGWINRTVLQRAQSGRRSQGEMLQALLAGCWARPVSAWSQGSSGAPSPQAPPGGDSVMPTRMPRCPPAAFCLLLLAFPFLDLRNNSGAAAACREAEQQEPQAAESPRGSPECPKLENWPPPLHCLLQHNYSSMTDMTN